MTPKGKTEGVLAFVIPMAQRRMVLNGVHWGVQGRGRDEGLLQALPTSIAGIVAHDYYVVQV